MADPPAPCGMRDVSTRHLPAGSSLLRQYREGMSRELARLRWLAIFAPLAFLAVVAYLVRGPAHEELHTFPGFLYMILVLAAGVSAFSFAIFAFIAGLEAQLRQRNQQLEAVLAIARATDSSFRLADMLDAALEAILAVTSAEAAEVWLLESGELTLERSRGAVEGLGEALARRAAESGESLVVHDLAPNPRESGAARVEPGFLSFGAFPLLRRGDVVGVLGVAAQDRNALSSEVEQRLLDGLGEQVAMAIENARLHARVLDETVLEERERLGHELHDGLAQMLGYVNTQTLAIKKLLASGRREEAHAEVARMEQNARRVYADVRAAILGLRASRDGLVESLTSYVEGFSRLADLEVGLAVDDGVRTLVLPASTEIQVVRIVQEALTNVRKHAQARRATVSVTAARGELLITVADSGRGFEPGRPRRTGWPHFGLQTMRERAEAIGGSMELSSSPRKGTTLRVRVPLPHQAAASHARLAG